jgi:peptide/nickel transport system permease protein
MTTVPPLPKTTKKSRIPLLGKAMLKNKGLVIGLAVVLLYMGTALVVYVSTLLGLQVTPYNPIAEFLTKPFAAPSLAHPFGTDELGRDVFSRILAASPNDVGVSFAVVLVIVAVGGTLGAVAGLYGGLVDELLMRVTDVFFGLPSIILAIVIAIIIGPGIIHMMYVLMLVGWPGYARIARGETLKIVNHNFIQAARLSGLGRPRILLNHVWPNISQVLLVFATLNVGAIVLAFAALSYFGLAVIPPAPDWGAMVNTYQDYLISAPWLPIFPGLIIAIDVIGFSMLGDGLRDVLELR